MIRHNHFLAFLGFVAAVLAGSHVAFGATASAASVPSASAAPVAQAAQNCPALLQHRFDRLQDEKPQSLCQYSGKVLLVVNTASYCGFTGQYAGLEKLYAQFKDQGLVVLGFPSNDFSQETDGNGKIAAFCENTYGVKFPMFSKSRVSGDGASAFYRQLASAAGEAPSWNFYKYLVARDGHVVGHFVSDTAPDNPRLMKAVARALAQPAGKAAP